MRARLLNLYLYLYLIWPVVMVAAVLSTFLYHHISEESRWEKFKSEFHCTESGNLSVSRDPKTGEPVIRKVDKMGYRCYDRIYNDRFAVWR